MKEAEDLTISSQKKLEIIDITDFVNDIVTHSEISNGFCYMFSPHTTVGLFINENEKGFFEDFSKTLGNLVSPPPYKHAHDPNHSPAHIISALLGQTLLVPIHLGRLFLGTWQRVFLIELDGPRDRRIKLTLFEV